MPLLEAIVTPLLEAVKLFMACCEFPVEFALLEDVNMVQNLDLVHRLLHASNVPVARLVLGPSMSTSIIRYSALELLVVVQEVVVPVLGHGQGHRCSSHIPVKRLVDGPGASGDRNGR